MVFWIGILIAVAFAYSSAKSGLYQAWTTLFNVLIAVYIGVRLGPVVQDFVPMQGQYCKTIAVLGAGLVTFLVLHGISYAFLIGQFEVTFPRGINKFGSVLLGFAAGLLVWSFVTLVICTTPFCENPFVKDVGFGQKGFEQQHMQPYLVWWCSALDKIVASPDTDTGIEQSIKDLLTLPPPAKSGRTGSPADANEPNAANIPAHPVTEPAPESNVALPP